MSIGAKDHIDKLLVKKYANKKVDNHENVTNLAVSANEMLGVMNDYADVQRNMLAMQANLGKIGQSLSVRVAYCSAKA